MGNSKCIVSVAFREPYIAHQDMQYTSVYHIWKSLEPNQFIYFTNELPYKEGIVKDNIVERFQRSLYGFKPHAIQYALDKGFKLILWLDPSVKPYQDVNKVFKREHTQRTMIFVIKVTTNKEERAVDLIADRARSKNLNVSAVLRPHGMKGYLLLEADDRDSAEEASFNLPYVKGIIGKTITYEEVKNMLEPAVETTNIEKGDVVEIIAEPFKKEKAKVLRVDKQKEEVVVSLLGAAVPMPVTIKLDNVKVIRREEMESEGENL